MRRITAGDLCERIKIQKATAGRDNFGGEVLTWTDSATIWAMVRERSGYGGAREEMLADRPIMVADYQIVIREKSATVSYKDRVFWNNLTLDVQAVTPHTPQRGYTMLRCEVAET